MEIVDNVKGGSRLCMGLGIGYVVGMGSGGEGVRGRELLVVEGVECRVENGISWVGGEV